jgi:predicted Zn-ribbon and HTH transcriptional regulator
MATLSVQPRSVSSLARELGLARGDVEDDLRHLIRSARAAGHTIVIEPARCKACGFVFGEEKLSKPSRCPQCKQSRIFEAQLYVEQL